MHFRFSALSESLVLLLSLRATITSSYVPDIIWPYSIFKSMNLQLEFEFGLCLLCESLFDNAFHCKRHVLSERARSGILTLCK